jgi:hypothetical protein
VVAKPRVLFKPALLARFFSNQKVLLSTDFGYMSYCKVLSWAETCSEKDRKDLCAEGVRLRELSEGNGIFKGFHFKETGAELK